MADQIYYDMKQGAQSELPPIPKRLSDMGDGTYAEVVKAVISASLSISNLLTTMQIAAAAPTYTDGQSEPLSGDANGNLRVIDRSALTELQSLGTKLDNIAAKIDTSNSDLTSLTTAVGTVQTAVTAVTAAVTALQTTVATGNASEATIAAQTASLTAALANIQTLQTTGITAIGQLHTDDLALQTLVTTGNTALTAIQTATAAGATASAQADALTMLASINTAAQGELLKLDTIAIAISTAVATLGAGKSLADIVTAITGTTSGVSALKTALAAIETGEAASLTAINAAIGAQADAAATSDSGIFSLIGLVKRGLGYLSRLPMLGQALKATSVPVTIASDQGTLSVVDVNNAAFAGVVPMVIGTAQTAQRSIGIICTTAGNVQLMLSDGSSLTIPVSVGFQTLPFAATTIVAAGTTATATYYNFK